MCLLGKYSTTHLNPQSLHEYLHGSRCFCLLIRFNTQLFCCVCFICLFHPETHDKEHISVQSTQSCQESHEAVVCHLITDSIISEFPFSGTTEMLSPEPLWSKLSHGDKSATVFCIHNRSSKVEREVFGKTETFLCIPYVNACLRRMKCCLLAVLFTACCYCTAFFSNNLSLPPTMKLLYGALSSHGTVVTNGEFVSSMLIHHFSIHESGIL